MKDRRLSLEVHEVELRTLADVAERYCAAHPRTMALVTEEADPERLRVFGAHEGVAMVAAGGERSGIGWGVDE